MGLGIEQCYMDQPHDGGQRTGDGSDAVMIRWAGDEKGQRQQDPPDQDMDDRLVIDGRSHCAKAKDLRVELIHTSATMACRVKPSQKAVPKKTWGESREKAKKSAMMGLIVATSSPTAKARIIHSP